MRREHVVTNRPVEYIRAAIDLAHLSSKFRGNAQEGIEVVNETLGRFPLDPLPPADRPYLELANFYADGAHRPDLARAVMSEYESEVDSVVRNSQALRLGVAGKITLADGDPELQPQLADVRGRIARLVGER